MINQQFNNLNFPISGYQQNFISPGYSIPGNYYSPISPNMIAFGNMNAFQQFPTNQLNENVNVNKPIVQIPNN